jgi:DNA-binding NtrC family response regulator
MSRDCHHLHDRPDSAHLVSAESGRARIFLAEDDDAMRELLAASLRGAGFEVMESPNGIDLAGQLGPEDPERFDLIISDIRMPGVTGFELLEGLNEAGGYPPTILITAFGGAEVHAEAASLGAAALFDKPFEIDALIAAASRLFATRKKRDSSRSGRNSR